MRYTFCLSLSRIPCEERETAIYLSLLLWCQRKSSRKLDWVGRCRDTDKERILFSTAVVMHGLDTTCTRDTEDWECKHQSETHNSITKRETCAQLVLLTWYIRFEVYLERTIVLKRETSRLIVTSFSLSWVPLTHCNISFSDSWTFTIANTVTSLPIKSWVRKEKWGQKLKKESQEKRESNKSLGMKGKRTKYSVSITGTNWRRWETRKWEVNIMARSLWRRIDKWRAFSGNEDRRHEGN